MYFKRDSLRVLFLLALATPVGAEETWDQTGAWIILIRSGDIAHCIARRSMEDGSIVEVGTEPSRDGGYFAIYNATWTDIEDGDESTVEFDFGDARFGGVAKADFANGVPGGYAFFDNPAFVDAFANKRAVKVIGRAEYAYNFDLTGTKKAVSAVLACQAAQADGDDLN